MEKTKDIEIKNAKIISTMLGYCHYGFTFQIRLETQTGYAIFGNRILKYGEGNYSDKALEAIDKILSVVGVDCWEDLKDKYVRIKEEWEGWDSNIIAIGNILYERWYDINDLFKEEEKDK